MKKLAIATLAIVLAAAGTSALAAGPKDPSERAERMDKILDLNDAQRQQVEAIFEKARAKHDAVQKETRQSLSTVLTPEQLKKLDEHKAKRDKKQAKKDAKKDRKNCKKDKKAKQDKEPKAAE